MASKYADPKFWIDAFDRAVSTFAQATVATLTAGVAGILDVDWAQVLSVGGLAALVSVLTTVAFRGAPDVVSVTQAGSGHLELADPVNVQVVEKSSDADGSNAPR